MGDEKAWRLLHRDELSGTQGPPAGLCFPKVHQDTHATKMVAFAPDDSCIARIARVNVVIVNEFDGRGSVGANKIIYTGNAAPLSCISFGPAAQNMLIVHPPREERSSFVLATGQLNGTIKLWDSCSTQLISVLQSHKNRIQDIIFSQVSESMRLFIITQGLWVHLVICNRLAFICRS